MLHQSDGNYATTWNGFYIYNNVFFNANSGISGIELALHSVLGVPKGYMTDLVIYGNSIFQALGTSSTSITSFGGSHANAYTNLYMKNNIFMQTISASSITGIPSTTALVGTVEINNNLYYSVKTANKSVFTQSGQCGDGYCTFAEWQALGHDANSYGPTSCGVQTATHCSPASFRQHLT